jgi:protein arginine kinase activator
MRCNQCGLNEAVIHLTQIVNNEMSTLHLCEPCAAAKGVEVGAPTPAPAPLTDFLAQIGKGIGGESTAGVGRCPSCNLGTADLKRTGRLGCSHCYTHFAPHLRSLLRRLHGGTQHVGKQHAVHAPAEEDPAARVLQLRRSLQRAVEAEDFERAARLRDEIRQLERSGAEAGEER